MGGEDDARVHVRADMDWYLGMGRKVLGFASIYM